MASNNVVKPARKANVEASIAVLDRLPFEKVLVKFILASPTQKAIKEFAQKYPDRWSQAITMIAKLRGYSERVEHDVTINIRTRLQAMGDAQLRAYAAELKLKIIDPHKQFLQAPIEGEAQKESPAEAGPKS